MKRDCKKSSGRREDGKVWKARGDLEDERREFLRKSAEKGWQRRQRYEKRRRGNERSSTRGLRMNRVLGRKKRREIRDKETNNDNEKTSMTKKEVGKRSRRKRKKYSGRSYTNTDSHPREDIRIRRSGPNSEIFDEFAREITMKASRPDVREEPVVGRFSRRRRPLNSAASRGNSGTRQYWLPLYYARIIGIRMWRTFSDGTKSAWNLVSLNFMSCA